MAAMPAVVEAACRQQLDSAVAGVHRQSIIAACSPCGGFGPWSNWPMEPARSNLMSENSCLEEPTG